MKIAVHEVLPEKPLEVIRWPGAQAFPKTFDYSEFAAVSILLSEETSKAALQAYSSFLADPKLPKTNAIDLRLFDNNSVPDSNRFFLSRLIVRTWTLFLHQNQVSIIKSASPANKSRVRTFKGLFDSECRSSARSYEQFEIEISPGYSALIGKLEIDSAAPASCIISLGDTFRAFGVFGIVSCPVAGSLLKSLSIHFEEQRSIWRWKLNGILPTVFGGDTCLFFFQGVANETTLELIIYLPVSKLAEHLNILKVCFGARA